ncbi:hypothetical protein Nepgr_015853 [Nepenthes gracilis]|uniref:Uncharacterized protein n=1 Tax=Nepenthes gracilis TaxID=150966 RepID=A0AAD3SP01_NEPGR|nr:hypothetical protein Nepgr_015853 [Nepenthes gracilis]
METIATLSSPPAFVHPSHEMEPGCLASTSSHPTSARVSWPVLRHLQRRKSSLLPYQIHATRTEVSMKKQGNRHRLPSKDKEFRITHHSKDLIAETSYKRNQVTTATCCNQTPMLNSDHSIFQSDSAT